MTSSPLTPFAFVDWMRGGGRWFKAGFGAEFCGGSLAVEGVGLFTDIRGGARLGVRSVWTRVADKGRSCISDIDPDGSISLASLARRRARRHGSQRSLPTSPAAEPQTVARRQPPIVGDPSTERLDRCMRQRCSSRGLELKKESETSAANLVALGFVSRVLRQ